MTISETRKVILAQKFAGAGGCLDGLSWIQATFADLELGEVLYPEDMAFMKNTPGWCPTGQTSIPGTTGFMIDTSGIGGDTYINGNYIGTTDAVLDYPAGEYLVTIKKPNYIDQSLPVTIIDGQYTRLAVSMVQAPTPSTGTSTTSKGAIVTTTNSTPKGAAAPGTKIKLGASNWFGYEHKNTGDATWHGYIGVKLVDEQGVTFTCPGDPTYTSSLAAGEVKYLWVNCTVPATGSNAPINGAITVSLIRTTVS
jgi:hypothetical protein